MVCNRQAESKVNDLGAPRDDYRSALDTYMLTHTEHPAYHFGTLSKAAKTKAVVSGGRTLYIDVDSESSSEEEKEEGFMESGGQSSHPNQTFP
jgi:hypothetical protein